MSLCTENRSRKFNPGVAHAAPKKTAQAFHNGSEAIIGGTGKTDYVDDYDESALENYLLSFLFLTLPGYFVRGGTALGGPFGKCLRIDRKRFRKLANPTRRNRRGTKDFRPMRIRNDASR